MPNHLTAETSPYLLQHASNPVDWYPWGQEAFDRATHENKPIFLSIGYAACHWCHVMAHESFEDPEIAELLNQNFICIKVDREERPDLDSIYMKAVMAMIGQGGWPMSVFLTPEGKPFYGGTYFPPVSRYNQPSFRDVLAGVNHAWQNDRTQLQAAARRITDHLQEVTRWNLRGPALDLQNLEKACRALIASYDWTSGGWGSAPKFPQPMAVEFLLRQAFRGDQSSLKVANHVLETMGRGGMYDLVGGGFHRYSTDDTWLIPHFEKMLYDNAQLAQVYLHAYCLTGNPAWRRICEATLDFITRELTGPQGEFFCSLDADSDGEEGIFYTWSLAEISHLADNSDEADLFVSAYGVSESGNFGGLNVLQRALSDSELAARFSITIPEVQERLEIILKRLFHARSPRIRPPTDDKVLVAWNAMAMQTFAEAACILKRPAYLEMATRNAAFTLDNLYHTQLFRSWRSGLAQHSAYLEDYASLILGLLALYQADPQLRWFSFAIRLANEMLERFPDPQGGFFDTSNDQSSLLIHPKDIQDNATPSGNALAANALLHLSAFTGNEDWRIKAEEVIGALQATAVLYPTAFAYWLSTLDFAVGPIQQVALVAPPGDPRLQPFIDVIWHAYHPRRVVAVGAFPPEAGNPALLRDRGLVNGSPTAYFCKHFTCQLPVTSPDELMAQLENARKENPIKPD
jgi:uncharacterized protein YyaL (SSP411 family)